MKTHWRKLENPEYLGSWDLDGDTVVEMQKVDTKIITGADGKQLKTILHLKGKKPMILNVINRLTIQHVHSEFIEDWVGKLITIFPTKTKALGMKMDCIRVRKYAPTSSEPAKPSKAKITDERLESAMQSIENLVYSSEELLTKFELSPEQTIKFDERFKD